MSRVGVAGQVSIVWTTASLALMGMASPDWPLPALCVVFLLLDRIVFNSSNLEIGLRGTAGLLGSPRTPLTSSCVPDAFGEPVGPARRGAGPSTWQGKPSSLLSRKVQSCGEKGQVHGGGHSTCEHSVLWGSGSRKPNPAGQSGKLPEQQDAQEEMGSRKRSEQEGTFWNILGHEDAG